MTDDTHLPHPALLNTWKHHAGWIRSRIVAAAGAGSAGVAGLPTEMVVVGTRLMDLYTGPHTAAEIAQFVFADLKANDRFSFDQLAPWLHQCGEYALTELPDGSKWTIRLGPADGRYVHLHPGRWAPHTLRVQANTLRSAVMAHAHARLVGGDPHDVRIVNEARGQYLKLLPVRELSSDGGLGAVIAVLDSTG